MESFAARIPLLEQIADGAVIQRIKIGDQETEAVVSADVRDRLAALEKLGKFGGLPELEPMELTGDIRILLTYDDDVRRPAMELDTAHTPDPLPADGAEPKMLAAPRLPVPEFHQPPPPTDRSQHVIVRVGEDDPTPPGLERL